MKIIGLDNGTTGSLSVYDTSLNIMALHTLPVKKELDYTKKAKHITRIDFPGMCELFARLKKDTNNDIHVYMEKPFTGGAMFMQNSIKAFRCFEAELIALEECGIGYTVINSKDWQKKLIPQGIKGSTELKKASLEIARRLYPYLSEKLNLSNADSVLIAHHFKSEGFKNAI